MALVHTCTLCQKEKIISNREFLICYDCVKVIVATEKKHQKQLKQDKKKGLRRFD